ncbi:Hypothetical protein BROD_2481 [Brucella sp. NF 2653]|uniref:Uncharacterized protein n=2 Tax=Brucella TaxID=234 RepID=A0A0H3AN20_BRUO2|nr:hypothetical protein BOV_0164 [Brucella ovis ATCC 25840]EEH15408.1 Hypothetical protein, conserved [Brucella ceti str. Cudo]EFG37156.1 conserved hypothetical protein [Brucella sp. NVSL 07-0026]EFM57000.1 Hypothetical protein BIBO1_1109 [Brucella inopinata BO1]EFM61590.1 Hypothetical protein BROD_2481 [Brucella sp. NF 2653]
MIRLRRRIEKAAASFAALFISAFSITLEAARVET